MTGLPRNTILVGDAWHRLAELPPDSVDCVITSPPYFALRNYGHPAQIGLEASVSEWVDHLLAVIEELGRVLKPAGTLWLNLGDSYARHPRHGGPAKSLVLGPEKLLLGLHERGWIVRNKLVWAKPNPTPSSVRDRLTCSWEPIYLLTHSAQYFFDLDAIRLPHSSQRAPGRQRPVRRGRAAWAGPLAGDQSGLDRLHLAGLPGHPLGKNPGDVWTIPTSTVRSGHHAAFPEALVERPVLAGCPERVCQACGQAWERAAVVRQVGRLAVLGQPRPVCPCQAPSQPGLVLDPFMGSGTTAAVAQRLGRDWLGIELNPEFVAVAEGRLRQTGKGADRAARIYGRRRGRWVGTTTRRRSPQDILDCMRWEGIEPVAGLPRTYNARCATPGCPCGRRNVTVRDSQHEVEIVGVPHQVTDEVDTTDNAVILHRQ